MVDASGLAGEFVCVFMKLYPTGTNINMYENTKCILPLESGIIRLQLSTCAFDRYKSRYRMVRHHRRYCFSGTNQARVDRLLHQYTLSPCPIHAQSRTNTTVRKRPCIMICNAPLSIKRMAGAGADNESASINGCLVRNQRMHLVRFDYDWIRSLSATARVAYRCLVVEMHISVLQTTPGADLRPRLARLSSDCHENDAPSAAKLKIRRSPGAASNRLGLFAMPWPASLLTAPPALGCVFRTSVIQC